MAFLIPRTCEVVIVVLYPSSPAPPQLPPQPVPSPAMAACPSTLVMSPPRPLSLPLSSWTGPHGWSAGQQVPVHYGRLLEDIKAHQADLCRQICPCPIQELHSICIFYTSGPSEKSGWLFCTREFKAPVSSFHLAYGFREGEGGGGEVVGK